MVLRLKLKRSATLGNIFTRRVKARWDLNKDIPTVKLSDQKLILDSNATIDEDGYTGEYVGEHRKLPASEILSILESIGGKMRV